MMMQLKAAAVTCGVALVFVALELAIDVKTGLAGLFVMGMASGLFIGGWMVHDAAETRETGPGT